MYFLSLFQNTCKFVRSLFMIELSSHQRMVIMLTFLFTTYKAVLEHYLQLPPVNNLTFSSPACQI